MHGELDGCLGVIKLNKEHNYNILSPNFAAEVTRGIASMEVNQTVSSIIMLPQLGQMFSNGTDFRLLAKMQQEGSKDAIAAYF
jgi:enoyl-CoA hydratase/carnithine racemase